MRSTTSRIKVEHNPPAQAEAKVIQQAPDPSLVQSRALYVLLGAYGVLMLVLAFVFRKIGLYDMETDFYGDYVEQARSILRGEIPIGHVHGPGYPLILGIVNLVIQEYFVTGRIISLVSSLLFLYLSYIMVSKNLGKRAGIITILIIMLNPTYFRYSYIASSDLFFTFLVALCVYISISLSERKFTFHNIWLGLMGGFLYMTRYNGVFFFAFYPALLVYRHRKSPLSAIASIALFMIGVSMILIPWGLYTKSKKGVFLYNANYTNIAWEIYGKGNVSWDEFWHKHQFEYKSFWHVFAKNPELFIQKIGTNLILNVSNEFNLLVGLLFIPIFIIGIWQVLREKRLNVILPFATFYISFYMIISLVAYSERYNMALLLFYGMICAAAFSWRPIAHSGITSVILSIAVLPNAVKCIRKFKQDLNMEPRDVLYISREFKRIYGSQQEGKGIMARKPQIAYYLNMKFRHIPYDADLTNLPQIMKREKAEYLYFSGIEYYLREKLRPLSNYQNPPPYLKTLIVNYHPFGVLYQLRDDSTFAGVQSLARPDTAQAPASQFP